MHYGSPRCRRRRLMEHCFWWSISIGRTYSGLCTFDYANFFVHCKILLSLHPPPSRSNLDCFLSSVLSRGLHQNYSVSFSSPPKALARAHTHNTTHHARRSGLHHLSSHRKLLGLLSIDSVKKNSAVPSTPKKSFDTRRQSPFLWM